MKKKRIIITVILLIVIGIVIVFIFLNKNKESLNVKQVTEETADQKINEINQNIISGMSKQQYTELTGKKAAKDYLLIGKDTILREGIDSKLEKIENVDKYKERNSELADSVESIIKDNFDSKIFETVTAEDETVVVRVTYKVYYYFLYLRDMELLQTKLMAKAGYEIEQSAVKDIKTSDQRLIDFYKAKVKAMEIMDEYLMNYYNNYEYFTTEILYKTDNINDPNAYVESYLLQVDGSTSKTFDFSTKKTNDEQQKRVDKYIEDAIKLGTLDEKNPLKLK